MSKSPRSSSIDPVVLVALGVGLVAIAIVLIVLQPSGAQTIDSASSPWGQLVVAFVTGLTTGGLSCLAVQGGLLASSLAHQIEQDQFDASTQVHVQRHGRKQAVTLKAPHSTNSTLPIFLFLAAKITAYTLLGALLGWLGSIISLSPVTRSVLMIAIGVFMIGNALRMFNVHPIFRYSSIEPPRSITRYIRKTAKGTDTFTPLFLGALTVFIPCGVTQAMMATALGTGSAMLGAGLMLAFTLGTSPVFFALAWLTTELGARLERFFMRFVAAVVLVFGLVTMNSGLNLIGSPLSFNNLFLRGSSVNASGLSTYSDPSTAQAYKPGPGEVALYVQNQGYFPQTLRVAAGQAFTLVLVTNQTYSCARDFVIPDMNYYQLLPATGNVQVTIPAQPAGTRLFFTCSMGMYTGQIVFE